MSDCTCADPSAVAQAIQENASTISGQIKTTGQYVDNTLHGAAHEGVWGAFDAIRFCRWAAPEVTGEGHVAWSMIYKAAATAMAIANATFQSHIAQQKKDMAENWLSHAEYKWSRFNGTYLPLESQLGIEMQTIKDEEMNCEDAAGRAATAVNSAFATGIGIISYKMNKMLGCSDKRMTRYVQHRQAVSLTDCTNYNLRDEKWWVEHLNDTNWSHRSTFIDLGRNLPSQALEYGQVADKLMSHVGQNVADVAGTFIQQLGYFGSRNDTFSPMTYLGGDPGSASGGNGINTVSIPSSNWNTI